MVKVYGIVLPTWVEHPRPYDNRWIVLFLRPYTWPIFEKNTGHFDVRQYHCKRLSFIEVRNRLAYQLVSGWWFQAIWKILVNGKDYPTYYGKIKKGSKLPTRFYWSTQPVGLPVGHGQHVMVIATITVVGYGRAIVQLWTRWNQPLFQTGPISRYIIDPNLWRLLTFKTP